MTKTVVNCPNCKRPVQADLDQVFDTNTDPSAKQRLLSGAFNIIQCPSCGYRGAIATPIVYHDPEKELLLTFFPPELGLPPNEQERVIGSLINQVMAQLPPEKRKAYLLRPKQSLTMQGLIDQVLEADGITKEMIQAGQQRLSLIQRLLMASSDEVRKEIIQQEDAQIDEDFFGLLERLAEAAMASGDNTSTQRMADLQKLLLENSSFGKKLDAQIKEVDAAVSSLKEAGKGLTREKLLDIVIAAPNDERVKALVSLARPGMDYIFFQLLSDKLEKAKGEKKEKLARLRDLLLQFTQEYDQEFNSRLEQARQRLETILAAEDVEKALVETSPVIDDIFLSVLSSTLEEAKKNNQSARLEKLSKIVAMIQQASAPPPEMEFIEKLLMAKSENEQRKLLEENQAQVTPELVNTLTALVTQFQNQEGQSQENAALIQQLSDLFKVVLRYSMEQNLKAQ
ncbi:MAG: CpXC domain-containing protein [Anaerolineales bacterium]